MSKQSKSQLTDYRKKHYTGLYGSWYAMKQRCGNSNNLSYKNYGGRGISYPENWESFTGFQEDMGDTYKKGLTLEREDNNQNYSASNCRWATRKEQNNNKRSNIVLTLNGETRPLALWAEKLGIDFGTLRSRYYRGMSVERILEPSFYRDPYLAN